MTKKERAVACVELLKAEFPDDLCSLTYEDPYQLLVAVRLSAQCTDARVNMVTPALFDKYPTPVEMAAADVEDVEELIRSTGFFRTKARDLVIMANQILDGFLIAGDIYGMPGAVVTDTHAIRIANRIGLVDTKDPKKVEFALRKLLPPEESNNFCHRCVLHGRATCTARKAHCERCCLNDVCKKNI